MRRLPRAGMAPRWHLAARLMVIWVVLQPAEIVCQFQYCKGQCLGKCEDCHDLIESLPREPQASAARLVDTRRAGLVELVTFFNSSDLCKLDRLYPLSLDGDYYSLAMLGGGADQLSYLGGAALARKAEATCLLAQAMTVDIFSQALRVAEACVGGSQRGCGSEGVRAVAAAVLARWRNAADGGAVVPLNNLLEAPQKFFSGQDGNESVSILAEYVARMKHSLLTAEQKTTSLPGKLFAHEDEAPGLLAYRLLTELALDLARHTRQMMDHALLSFGLNNLVVELSSALPRIRAELPTVAYHTEVYGRHWDVLEMLLLKLQEEREAQGHDQPLRMAEMGVACGAIGLHLLLRFPDLQYIGADPTIVQSVRDAYVRFGPRASLQAVTSEELNAALPAEEQFDFVFVDGPHTYRNVRNDIEMWLPRVRSGGILAGHDFTQAHPPLLWAVLEQRMHNFGGSSFNVGMDGVWWWRIP